MLVNCVVVVRRRSSRERRASGSMPGRGVAHVLDGVRHRRVEPEIDPSGAPRSQPPSGRAPGVTRTPTACSPVGSLRASHRPGVRRNGPQPARPLSVVVVRRVEVDRLAGPGGASPRSSSPSSSAVCTTKTSPSLQEGDARPARAGRRSRRRSAAVGGSRRRSARRSRRWTARRARSTPPDALGAARARARRPRQSAGDVPRTSTCIWARVGVLAGVLGVVARATPAKSICRAIAPATATAMPLTMRAAVPLLSWSRADGQLPGHRAAAAAGRRPPRPARAAAR